MQRLEVSGAVRPLQSSLGIEGLNSNAHWPSDSFVGLCRFCPWCTIGQVAQYNTFVTYLCADTFSDSTELMNSGLGGLGVTCCHGFKPSQSRQDFSGRKNPQHAFLRKGSKAVGPMSQICGM